MTQNQNNSRLIVISGPSGVGKGTICKQIVEKTGAWLSVSATTRPIGEGELDGREYIFLTREKFDARLKNGEFLEHAEVFGNLYGTPWPEVKQALDQNRIVLLEIDVQGALAAKKIYTDAVLIFILPPRHGDLKERIENRGRGEDDATANKRLGHASNETAQARQHYDHMVTNDKLDHAVEEIIQIINAKTGE